MEESEQRLAVASIKDIQQYLYDSSIGHKSLSYEERLVLTKAIKRGTCTTKHEVLADDLQNIGLDIIFLTFPFFWQEIPVIYPEEMTMLLEMMPQQNHLALAIMIENSQKVIDITWDPALAQAGFVVPEIGEAIVDTPLAVIPFSSPVAHKAIDERTKYLQKRWEQIPNNAQISLFYMALNKWLMSLRGR